MSHRGYSGFLLIALLAIILAGCFQPASSRDDREIVTPDISPLFDEQICLVNGEPRIQSFSKTLSGDYQITYQNRDGDVVTRRVYWADGAWVLSAATKLATGICP